MRTEYRRRAARNLSQAFDETGTLGPKAFHHVAIVHDFMPHVDGRPIFDQCAFYDIDRADDASTETTGLSQDYLHRIPQVLERYQPNATRRTLAFFGSELLRSTPTMSNIPDTAPKRSR